MSVSVLFYCHQDTKALAYQLINLVADLASGGLPLVVKSVEF